MTGWARTTRWSVFLLRSEITVALVCTLQYKPSEHFQSFLRDRLAGSNARPARGSGYGAVPTRRTGMQRRQALFVSVFFCVAILAMAAVAVAQVDTATLSGLVTDPQGLAVRGAKVILTYKATGAERSTLVD